MNALFERGTVLAKCTRCKEEKPRNDFYRKGHLFQSMCIPCHKVHHAAAHKKRLVSDPKYKKKFAEVSRQCQLRKRFGLDFAAYDAILRAQGGGCSVCGRQEKMKQRAGFAVCCAAGAIT